VPSFYALEALRAAEGALPGFEEVASRAQSTTRARLGWPAPEDANDEIDEAEYDLALLANLAKLPKKEATGAANYLLTANEHLARALRGRARRWLRRWTPNDGLVDPDQLALESIARHQFGQRPFSASALQLYADCPYRFFLSTIMRLQLRREPVAIEVIDPLTRGSLFHEAQFEVLTELRNRGLLPLQPDSLPIAFELVDRGLERSTTNMKTGSRLRFRVYGRRHQQYQSRLARMVASNVGIYRAWIPDKFELSFGLATMHDANAIRQCG
jgi:hypothetical protein